MPPEVRLEPFRFYQVPLFLSFAAREGWRCHEWEFQFLLEHFPQGCFVARRDGRTAGFVTSVRYGASGWIGNLLVQEEHRGHGLGRSLMEQALAALDDARVATIWLTASEAGRPLYEKLGFIAIDWIIRWRCTSGAMYRKLEQVYDQAAIEDTDRLGWGDRRSTIIGRIAELGTVLEEAGGFCMVQATGDGFQLGPWGCRGEDAAEKLMHRVMAAAGPGPVFLDVPESNGHAAAMLQARGFASCGMTVLMYRGAPPEYNARHIYALASMGSMG